MMLNITVVGTGYVGLSNAVLFARQHTVISLDIDVKRVELINQCLSPIVDDYIEKTLKDSELKLTATLNKETAYRNADYIIIATPTNYDSDTNSFDTSSIESVIADILPINTTAPIIIKSTIPVGYTAQLKQSFKQNKLYLVLSFCERAKHSMTTYIHHEL